MEKYGTIPKRFTKAWWEHFWYYYKWRVLSVIFAVFLVMITVTQCVSQVKYDMTFTYVGEKVYEDSKMKQMCEIFKTVIDDVNNDGQTNVSMQQITVAKDGTAQARTEYESAMRSKLAVEFQAGETYLFLFSKQEIERLLERDSSEQIFVRLNDWVDSDEFSEQDVLSKDGQPYAINLKGNSFLESNKFYSEDLYMAIRCIRPKDKNDEKEISAYNNAVKVANYILTE